MAPPRRRDPGFSRRHQYGLFAGYVAAVLSLVVCLFLILIARFDPIAFQGIRGLFLDITAPVSGAGRGIARGAGDIGGGVGVYLDAANQNRSLKAEIAAMRGQLIEARRLTYENQRLRAAIRLIDPGNRPIVAARIVATSVTGSRRYAVLGAGAADGVRAGQPVRAAEGLIGRIVETGAHAARIALLIDGATSVPVVAVRTGQPALILGRGEEMLDVRSTQLGAPPLRRGDLLVTSGTGGVYPSGVPAAVVTGGSGEIARARPLAATATLDLAMVLPEMPAPPPLTLPPGPAGSR